MGEASQSRYPDNILGSSDASRALEFSIGCDERLRYLSIMDHFFAHTIDQLLLRRSYEAPSLVRRTPRLKRPKLEQNSIWFGMNSMCSKLGEVLTPFTTDYGGTDILPNISKSVDKKRGRQINNITRNTGKGTSLLRVSPHRCSAQNLSLQAPRQSARLQSRDWASLDGELTYA